MQEIRIGMENTGKTLMGIKVMVNPYMPEDCILVSPKIFEILKAASLADAPHK